MTRIELLLDLLTKHPRVGIYGHPLTGKTTLSDCVEQSPVPFKVIHTDEYIAHHNATDLLVTEVIFQGKCVVEGTLVPRLLRKSCYILEAVIVLTKCFGELTPKQEALAKGTDKIFMEAIGLNPKLKVFYPDQGAS